MSECAAALQSEVSSLFDVFFFVVFHNFVLKLTLATSASIAEVVWQCGCYRCRFKHKGVEATARRYVRVESLLTQ